MSDDLDLEDRPDDTPAIKQIRQAQRADRAARIQAEARATQLETQAQAGLEATRKLAFVEAGVDISSPAAKYFIKGYDGDLNVDAIKAAATEIGLVGAPPPPVTDPQLVEHQRIAGTHKDSTVMTSTAEYAEAIAKAKTADEVFHIARRFGSPFAE